MKGRVHGKGQDDDEQSRASARDQGREGSMARGRDVMSIAGHALESNGGQGAQQGA